jgi:hypothetical protein
MRKSSHISGYFFSHEGLLKMAKEEIRKSSYHWQSI